MWGSKGAKAGDVAYGVWPQGGVRDLVLLPSSLAALHPPTAIIPPRGPLETVYCLYSQFQIICLEMSLVFC